jgi:hypothetical protein
MFDYVWSSYWQKTNTLWNVMEYPSFLKPNPDIWDPCRVPAFPASPWIEVFTLSGQHAGCWYWTAGSSQWGRPRQTRGWHGEVHCHRIHGAGIYTNIGGILMVNVTIFSIHGSYGSWNVCLSAFVGHMIFTYFHICSDIFTKSRERTLGSTSSQTAMNWICNVSNMGVGNCVTR